MEFSDLRLIEPIRRAVAAEGYTTATPIQEQTIPAILQGRDVLGCAQTGTGKTAAFALPLLQRLANAPRTAAGHTAARVLVLAPTRELAGQIADSFRTYGRHLPLRHAVIYGGVSQHGQVQALRQGVDVLIATPGRLLDLVNQRHADLRRIETLVLDEADRMLDMGFIHDIQRIIAMLPDRRQALLFSATMPPAIRKLADNLLRKPVTVQVAPEAPHADGIEQSVYFVAKADKPALLTHLIGHLPMSRAIVFTRTKHGADRVVRHLRRTGADAEAIHGNKSQNARQRSLDRFADGRVGILVATDIASRGIDVDGISHVVNYDLSHDPTSYVHRIGRTARAGASGAALSFCDHDERPHLQAIERLLRCQIPVVSDHPTPLGPAPRGGVKGSRASSARPRRPRGAHHPADQPARPRRRRSRDRRSNGHTLTA